jgi:hypothetical protein
VNTITSSPLSRSPARPSELNDIPGWFRPLDQSLFAFFLEATRTAGSGAGLVEMGCYLGKSTVVIGRHRREGEPFTVCDLFGDDSPGGYSMEATRDFYRTRLNRASFEANYLAFHDQLPAIIQGRTDLLADVLEPGGSRFVHIDASHMYADVSADIDIARTALHDGGVVALDDYRTEHTPGVSAAVWEAVFNKDMRPVCLSGAKMYATWGEPESLQAKLQAHLPRIPGCRAETQQIAGRPVLRLSHVDPPKWPTPVVNRTDRPQRPLTHRVALALLPPVVTQAVRRTRKRRLGTHGSADVPRVSL